MPFAGTILGLEHEHLAPALRERARRGEPDHARADHYGIDVHPIRHAASLTRVRRLPRTHAGTKQTAAPRTNRAPPPGQTRGGAATAPAARALAALDRELGDVDAEVDALAVAGQRQRDVPLVSTAASPDFTAPAWASACA
jgi:hypothetical protein